MSRKNARQLMEELYGTQRRKGIDKYSKEHPLDVVKFCFIGRDEDCLRAMHLINVAILHDVVEDFGHKGYTLDKVQVVVGLGPAEVRLLDLLTRKPGREEDYLPSLCRDEDAARIKLADRIANCQDLLQWVKDEGAFPRMPAGFMKNTSGKTRCCCLSLRRTSRHRWRTRTTLFTARSSFSRVAWKNWTTSTGSIKASIP